ncbi:heterokaryon incompatibility protein-domain-containing protein [Chaetomium fimeti]|uniref:Heterokaryon incompatibility protein-domain-containing protein n=1 Tax=Chaetomium fimeti TaxID=1854472 RepID=A0AAE0HCX7_9PEZI|nr:heterokaryon incompatibility protein-domain-containing protein [Chaetomium fimeti]
MSTPNPQPYPYLPLDPSTHEIRLLTLSYPPNPPPSTNPPTPPPSSAPTYTLTLTHAALSPSPPSTTHPPVKFTALSYVWGLPTTTTALPHLTINTLPVPVTPNLHSAITRLARQRWAGHLWVDALCINQADTAEKNTQVPLMSRIYGAAEGVLVWLGPEGDGAALRVVRDLGGLFREQVRERLGGVGDAGRVEAFVRTVRGFAVTEGGGGGDGGTVGFHFEAVWRLFRGRVWWRRVWIIQEVVLARKAVVMCGADPEAGVTSVDWEDVSECTSDDGAIQATDPRDRIYGLLGMVREKDRRRIPIDYSPAMTINKVLFAVGKVLLENHGPDILCFCQKTPQVMPVNVKDKLPSWVPDWTAPRMMPQIGGVSFGTESEAQSRGDASGGARWRDWAPKSRVGHLVYENPVVSLPGVIVGRVQKVGRVFKAAPGSPAYLNECHDWLLEVDQMVKECASVVRDVDKETWRVPIADMGLVKRADAEDPNRFIHGFNVLTGRESPPLDLDGEAAKQDWMMSESWDYRRVWKVYNRRALIDDSGRPGLGPENTAVSDEIAVLAGAHVPFVLRGELSQINASTPPRYQLVGPTYVFGLADGGGIKEGKAFGEIELR